VAAVACDGGGGADGFRWHAESAHSAKPEATSRRAIRLLAVDERNDGRDDAGFNTSSL